MKKISVKEARKQYKQNNGRVTDDSVKGFIELQGIGKVYGNRVQAVCNFDLSVAKNEFIVLVGPSGCGKSTTLRMIAGLEEITDGKLYIDNVLANYLESKDRDIAMVFQSYALYPNMTVYDNIGFGLQVRGLPKEEIRQKVFRAAEILDLGPYLDRKPKELSGGQMQRVALGRAIVRDAKLFLMDEPLSNLDAKLRVQMRSEIVKLHRSIQATTIYVTHDQTEAMTMADRIVIMNQGVVQQIGTPIEVYNEPANVFVATFIGNPPMNVFRAELKDGRLGRGGDSLALPRRLTEAYGSFLKERCAFFADLQEKARLTEEKTLLDEIAELKKRVKKLPPKERAACMRAVTEKALELQRAKGFFRFGTEEAEGMCGDAENANAATVLKDLAELEALISGSDLAVAAILKQYESAGIPSAPKETAPAQGKKRGGQPTESLQQENDRKIGRYIDEYAAAVAENSVLAGIRPEDIHFCGKFNGNRSEPVAAVADLVELLGSDFCMHVGLFGADVIVKRSVGDVVPVGAQVSLCFDLDKIKLFDPVSGKAIVAALAEEKEAL